jgi:superfamily II DNA helicase RecQ
MAFRFFVVPIQDGGEAESELNAFLNAHRVLNVDRRWVEQGSQSFWTFCIDYLPVGSKLRTEMPRYGQKERIDYKEKLPADQFRIFANLRDLRKEIAQAEAVPIYTIFTNEQLAKIVTEGVRTKTDLEKIDGVGEARASKYAPRFLERLSSLLGSDNEASGKSV